MKSFRGRGASSGGRIVSSVSSQICTRLVATSFTLIAGSNSCMRFRVSVLRPGSVRQAISPYHISDRNRTFHTSSSLLTRPQLSYRIAVACSGKGAPFNPEKSSRYFDPQSHESLTVVPHLVDSTTRRRRKPEAGEDAFFVSNVKGDPGAVAFAVADGVGGWAESRVDPGEFSRGLCSSMAQVALSWQDSSERIRPKALLQIGYDRLLEERTILAGGSTASVGVARPDGGVELANLGDSGSVLLRRGAVHYYSTPQTHAFNTPFQLSIIPPRIRAQAAIFGGMHFEDLPRDAAVTTVNMQHGDVLVLATDGVFDNLNNQDILKIISGRMNMAGAWTDSSNGAIGISACLGSLTRMDSLNDKPTPSISDPEDVSTSAPSSLPQAQVSSYPSSKNAPTYASTARNDRLVTPPGTATSTRNVYRAPNLQTLLAATIVAEAKLASLDMRRDGPFAKEAQRYFPSEWYRGGKVDDITVLVIMAVEENS